MLHLTEVVTQAKAAIEKVKDVTALDSVRVKFLGKKGHITLHMLALRNLPAEERPLVGKAINKAKQEICNTLNIRKNQLKNKTLNMRLAAEKLDISLPGRQIEGGSLHPVTRTIDRIEEFFSKLGCHVVSGPEIEDDYHNFNALNIPIHHPARDSHDTFWFDNRRLLRTQTSSIQIRSMKTKRPPIRIIASGRVYRNDYDQTHTPMFHQIEGLIIDYNISFSNLKGILNNFLTYFFEKKIVFVFDHHIFHLLSLQLRLT